jgi:hypothetical protein
MKTKLLLSLVLTFGLATQSHAGNIERFRINCKGAANTYGIAWSGSWNTYPIYLERSSNGLSGWIFEAGEFDFSPGDTGSKVPNNHYYRMMQWNGSGFSVGSNIEFVPWEACTPPP